MKITRKKKSMPAGKHSRTNEKALKKYGSARSKRMK